MNHKEELRVMRAFSDTNRLKVLALLRQGEKCACEILTDMNISQPTLSHHMKILVDSGVVQARVNGKWTHYSISPMGTEYALKTLSSITDHT